MSSDIPTFTINVENLHSSIMDFEHICNCDVPCDPLKRFMGDDYNKLSSDQIEAANTIEIKIKE